VTDTEQEAVASRIADRLLVMVQVIERLKALETQTARIVLDSERIESRLQSLEHSSWKAAGALAALLFVIEFARHFKVF